MPNYSTPFYRLASIAVLAGCLVVPGALAAAPADASDEDQSTAAQPHRDNDGRHSKAMEQPIEKRIETLRSKLSITNVQEEKWNAVAQVMRDNETGIHQLIRERHENTASMTALDDLRSYEKIAQAHVDGLQKLIPVFQSLYDDMSDDQKRKADAVFSRFEGHQHNARAKKD